VNGLVQTFCKRCLSATPADHGGKAASYAIEKGAHSKKKNVKCQASIDAARAHGLN
jgi:hypothetical protein